MTINFAGIDNKKNDLSAQVLLQSMPYDGTSSWGKGADMGFEAFLEAAENMELYDIETDSEPYEKGIHILEPMNDLKNSSEVSPEKSFEMIYKRSTQLLEKYHFDLNGNKKLLTFFGGEHSISIGIIKAFAEKFENLSVLHLDAHSDLRPDYENTPYNHACAMHLPSQWCNIVQTGIRSMAQEEKKYIKKENLFTAKWINDQLKSKAEHGSKNWMDKIVSKLGENVYISLDLDVFDPSIMPSTGTPEPGGLDWYAVTGLLKKVFEQKKVLGFDIVELAPIKGSPAPNFLTAKLYYKMLAYYFNA